MIGGAACAIVSSPVAFIRLRPETVTFVTGELQQNLVEVVDVYAVKAG